jgi:hypothetical protein
MGIRILRIAGLIAALLAGAGSTIALARPDAGVQPQVRHHAAHGGPLSGNWRGYISRQTSYGVKRQRITISVNAKETAGSWQLNARCYGALTLDSISDGYHHFLRHVAHGADCAGGDVDCLKPAAAGAIYDAVTSHLGGSWDTSGTLKRIA